MLSDVVIISQLIRHLRFIAFTHFVSLRRKCYKVQVGAEEDGFADSDGMAPPLALMTLILSLFACFASNFSFSNSLFAVNSSCSLCSSFFVQRQECLSQNRPVRQATDRFPAPASRLGSRFRRFAIERKLLVRNGRADPETR